MKSMRFLSRPTLQRGLLFALVSLLALVALSLIGSAPAARGQFGSKTAADTITSAPTAGVIAGKPTTA